jgi:ssDNA-binding replication factor A large subunit
MYDFETLIGELLQQRPELNRDEVLRRIEDKKRTVGAGYLTDQGALFLVAGELGVSLRKDDASSDLAIGDLYIGANDITVVARVLAVYPVATYNKKDGGAGKYQRMALFDGKNLVRLTVWEEGLEQIAKLGLKVDTPVRVANAYVKQGLDGKPNLNLGRRGKVEVLTDEKTAAKLPLISTMAQKLPNLTKEEQFVALECVVSSEPRYSEFVRSDGSEGSLFQFGVVRDGGKETRVVIWSPSEKPELKRGQKVKITNVRARRSNNGDFEVHGDAGSSVIAGPPAERSTLRVAATSSSQSTKVILGVGKDRKVKFIELGKGVKEPAQDEVVGVMPDQVTEGRSYCRSAGSIQAAEDNSFPTLDGLATKLQEVKEEDAEIMVEVIALSHGSVDDVRLKDGSTVKKGELVVGDDTGEMKLVAWRDLSSRVSGIQPGERLRLVGVASKSTRMGGWVLQLSNFSVIERLRGATRP